MNHDELDTLLKQPLGPVADNGFSAHLFARIEREERRHDAIVTALVTAAALALCLAVPVHHILGDIAAVILQMAMTPMIGVAAALLALTFLIDRVLWDRRLFQI
jgi:hypothetical protein